MALAELGGLLLLIVIAYLAIKLKKEREMPKDIRRRAFSNDEKIKIAWKHLKEHGEHCAHCPSDEDLDFDHIKPLARGGHNGLSNMHILCGRCNSSKGARQEG